MGMKLKDIIKENSPLVEPDGTIKGGPNKKDDEWNKGLNELVITTASLTIIFKLIQKWAAKNQRYINKLKDLVKKLLLN